MAQEHRWERLVRLLNERIENRIKFLSEYLQTDEGRPAFQIMLSKQEELERYMNPTMRAEMEGRILQSEGPEGVTKYTNRMREAMLEEV